MLCVQVEEQLAGPPSEEPGANDVGKPVGIMPHAAEAIEQRERVGRRRYVPRVVNALADTRSEPKHRGDVSRHKRPTATEEGGVTVVVLLGTQAAESGLDPDIGKTGETGAPEGWAFAVAVTSNRRGSSATMILHRSPRAIIAQELLQHTAFPRSLRIDLGVLVLLGVLAEVPYALAVPSRCPAISCKTVSTSRAQQPLQLRPAVGAAGLSTEGHQTTVCMPRLSVSGPNRSRAHTSLMRPVMEFGEVGPERNNLACSQLGAVRAAILVPLYWPLQRLGVSRDGSLVVLEVTVDFSLFSQSQVPPEQMGIYVVHADGSSLRRSARGRGRRRRYRVSRTFSSNDSREASIITEV